MSPAELASVSTKVVVEVVPAAPAVGVKLSASSVCVTAEAVPVSV